MTSITVGQCLVLVRMTHARFVSDTTRFPMVTAKSVIRQCPIVHRGPLEECFFVVVVVVVVVVVLRKICTVIGLVVSNRVLFLPSPFECLDHRQYRRQYVVADRREPVWPSGKGARLVSRGPRFDPLRFSFLFNNGGLWTLPGDFAHTISETFKCLTQAAARLNAESFRW